MKVTHFVDPIIHSELFNERFCNGNVELFPLAILGGLRCLFRRTDKKGQFWKVCEFAFAA